MLVGFIVSKVDFIQGELLFGINFCGFNNNNFSFSLRPIIRAKNSLSNQTKHHLCTMRKIQEYY